MKWLGLSLIIMLVGLGGFWYVRFEPLANRAGHPTAGSVAIAGDVTTATLHSPGGDLTVTGVASRQFIDGIFVHGVSATLPELPTGQRYAGWLVSAADTAHPLPTGTLTKDTNGWSLTFSANTDDRWLGGVLVTVQPGDSLVAGPTVLEGTFLP